MLVWYDKTSWIPENHLCFFFSFLLWVRPSEFKYVNVWANQMSLIYEKATHLQKIKKKNCSGPTTLKSQTYKISGLTKNYSITTSM